jgi:hypothetical protein
MKKLVFAIGLMALFLVLSSRVSAQSHNVGYYIKVDYSNNVTTYEKVDSRYLAGIEDEPTLSTDTEISWSTSDSCDDGGETACISGMKSDGDERGLPRRVPVHVTRGARGTSTMTFTFNDVGDDIPDRVEAPGKRPPKLVMKCIACGDDFNDDDVKTGVVREIGRFPFEEPTEAEPCEAEDINDSEGLTSEEKALIADFLNSQTARDLWAASNFIPSLYFSIRREQGGLLMPDGGSWDFYRSDDPDATACVTNLGVPVNRPPGSILVHTHPWRNGENQEMCNDYEYAAIYENTIGEDDADALSSLGLEVGLILDGDGFIIYGPNGTQRFVKGECGFTRA